MPSYRAYSGTAQGLQIEVEGVDASSASYAEGLSGSVLALAQQFSEGFRALADKQRPQQMQVDFGLRALSSGGFAIAQASDTVNFRITLTWSERQASDLNALSGLVPRP